MTIVDNGERQPLGLLSDAGVAGASPRVDQRAVHEWQFTRQRIAHDHTQRLHTTLAPFDQQPPRLSAVEMVSVLLVEDSGADACLLQDALSRSKRMKFCITHVSRLSSALCAVVNGVYDIVLLDLSLPDSHGIAGLRKLKGAAKHTPVTVLSGSANEERIAEARQAGAANYLLKGEGDVSQAILHTINHHAMQGKFSDNTSCNSARGMMQT